ncbi:MAG: serine/threonine protein kinase, partial [Planctomycetes bacterium]|nr:serine/threonine protein kinase [Planctomycetota bacterium]
MADLVGRSILGFRILAKVKDGGMSTVWKAVDAKDRVFAVKMINEKSFESSEMRSALKREAEITQALVHPNIIRVFGYHEAEPRPFILEEYFESENLKFVIYHEPQRLQNRMYRLMRQMAEAVQFSIAKGVIHRDLKPENILVSAGGDGRLIDFSIALTGWDRWLQFGKTTKGTPLYMSPEQIAGRRLDGRSDQYSFGVMLFEMLAKKPPFVGMTETAILDKHLLAAAPSLRSIDSTIAPELDGLVGKMLAKDPKGRFEDLTQAIIYLRKCEKREEEIREREERGRARRESGVTTPGAVASAAAGGAAAGAAAPGREPTRAVAIPGSGAGRKEPTRA